MNAFLPYLAPANGPVADFPVEIELAGQFEPGSLEVSIDHESILDRLSGGPLYSGVIQPGPPLRDLDPLAARAREAARGASSGPRTGAARSRM